MGKKITEPSNTDIIWEFTLYTARVNSRSKRAFQALEQICEKYLPNRYKVKIVDVLDDPSQVPPDILALPTVVRNFPLPERRVVGDLSAHDKAVAGLGLHEA